MSKKEETKGMSRREFIKRAGVGALGLTFLGGTFTSSYGQSPVNLGVVAPLDTELGEEAKKGASFGADLVNSSVSGIDLDVAKWSGIPNLGGSKLNLTFANHGGKPGKAAEAVKGLSGKVSGVVGLVGDEALGKASEAAQQKGLPFLDATSIAPYLTRRGFDTYFRLPGHLLLGLRLFFRMAKQYEVEENDFIMVTQEKPGVDKDVEFVQGFTKGMGFNFQASKLEAGTTQKMEDMAYSLKAKEPDAVVLDVSAELSAAAIKVLYELPEDERPSIVLVDQYTRMKDKLSDLLKEDVRTGFAYTFINLPFLPIDPEVPGPSPAVDSQYKKQTGEKLEAPSALALGGVKTLATALNKAESKDKAALLQALKGISIRTNDMVLPWPGIDFSTTQSFKDTNQNIMAKPIVARLDKEGNYMIAGAGGVGPLSLVETINNFLACRNTICLYL